ncbi:helix-turn-helix transcriptional regulator [Veillonella sp. 3310]|uniref:helix-turn-helix transcriptional regulator n=1 Tax=Veillonella sp. 3310 TaxID=2490956 RepID=UPI000FD638EF|nr:helix-turn-helix transcriptional regulator [Veillonella sp. 3310]
MEVSKHGTRVRWTKGSLKDAVLNSKFGIIARDRFIRAKEKRNLRYEDISYQAKISQSDLSKYLTRNIILSDEEFTALEELLGVEEGYLNPFKLLQIEDDEIEVFSNYLTTSSFRDATSAELEETLKNKKVQALVNQFQKDLSELIRGE